jgi:hypothetical protein
MSALQTIARERRLYRSKLGRKNGVLEMNIADHRTAYLTGERA